MHILIACLGYLSLFFLYRIFKRYENRTKAFLVILLFALNWAFIIYSTQYILSDIPYLFFSSFTLLAAIHYIEEKSSFNKWGFLVILGLLLSYFTRYTGLILFLSIVLILFLKRKENGLKKIFFIGSVFLFFFMIWNLSESLFSAHLPSHMKIFFLIDPYAPEKGNIFTNPLHLITRSIGGLRRIYSLLGNVSFLYFLRKAPLLNYLLCGFISFLTLFGLWSKFREDKDCLLHYYFLFYLISISFWHFTTFIEGVRYLLPIVPFIFFYFLFGLFRLLRPLPKRFSLFCFSILFIFSLQNLFEIPKPSQITLENISTPFKNFLLLQQWIKMNLPDKGIVLSRKPAVTYFYTGHKAVEYLYTSDPERIWQQVLKGNVRYIVVDEFSRATSHYLLPFIHRYNDRLKLLHRIGNTHLFEIKE
jgi:hypothetical protein